jgi:hypothetical protein
MNDPRLNDSGASEAVGAGNNSCDTMAARVPEATRTLRRVGVVRVVASYDTPMCMVSFLDANGNGLMPPRVDVILREVLEVFERLVKQHASAGEDVRCAQGIFEWDLVRDRLQHTVTYHGL